MLPPPCFHCKPKAPICQWDFWPGVYFNLAGAIMRRRQKVRRFDFVHSCRTIGYTVLALRLPSVEHTRPPRRLEEMLLLSQQRRFRLPLQMDSQLRYACDIYGAPPSLGSGFILLGSTNLLAVSHPKAAVSNGWPCRGPTPPGRVQRSWVEAAQNTRQLEVAGFICKAPWRGLHPTAPAVSQLKAAVSNCRPPQAPTPSAAPSVHGWKPHRTPGN